MISTTCPPPGPCPRLDVSGRSPAQEVRAEYEPRNALAEDEGSVGKGVQLRGVVELGTCLGRHALRVELGVHRVGPDLAGVQPLPHGREAVVVLTPAERARAVPSGERRRLVEEEELGEASRLEQRVSVPPPELQAARDPALSRIAAPDAARGVMQAAAISVHEPTCWIGDEVAEWSDAVLERHGATSTASEARGYR